jgi:hypothetical protein
MWTVLSLMARYVKLEIIDVLVKDLNLEPQGKDNDIYRNYDLILSQGNRLDTLVIPGS